MSSATHARAGEHHVIRSACPTIPYSDLRERGGSHCRFPPLSNRAMAAKLPLGAAPYRRAAARSRLLAVGIRQFKGARHARQEVAGRVVLPVEQFAAAFEQLESGLRHFWTTSPKRATRS